MMQSITATNYSKQIFLNLSFYTLSLKKLLFLKENL